MAENADHPTTRLLRRVTIDDDECWRWCGSIESNGYGRMRVDGRRSMIHRVAYEVMVGPIPEGLTIDHLCGVRNCINPDHLEAVTRGENSRRSSHRLMVSHRTDRCGADLHDLTGDNVYLRKDRPGRRECRACRTAARRRYEQRLAEIGQPAEEKPMVVPPPERRQTPAPAEPKREPVKQPA